MGPAYQCIFGRGRTAESVDCKGLSVRHQMRGGILPHVQADGAEEGQADPSCSAWGLGSTLSTVSCWLPFKNGTNLFIAP